VKIVRIFFLIVIILFSHYNGFGQRRKGKVSGYVLDAETNKPVPFLTVFVKNSTRGTVTAENGYYILENLNPGSYELVFQHLSYNTYKERVNITAGKEVKLETKVSPKTIDINEVVKTPDFQRWRKNYKTFKKIFLGGLANLSVRLKNPEDLFFYYNPESKLLSGYADKPLIILNKVLGYRITYYLDFFKYYEEDHYYTFTGSAYYEDLKPGIFLQEINWRKNREACYNGSLMEFLRCLYDTTYIKQGYSVGGVLPFEESFTQIDSSLTSIDSLKTNDDNKNKAYRYYSDLPYVEYVFETENVNEKRLQFSEVLNIGFGYNISGKYWNDTASELSLNEEFIVFDRNGNIYPPLGLVSHGLFASKRNMRYMLPIDYYPGEKK